MAELLPERLGQSDEAIGQVGGEASDRRRKRSKVTSVLQWTECFHAYIGIFARQQPEQVTDLLAYASLIIHAARKFKGDAWLQYDKNFRRYAEVHPSIQWAETNPSIWTMAFCNAQPRPHCELCFSIDRETWGCEDYTPSEKPATKRRKINEAPEIAPAAPGITPICINWNKRGCTSSTCTYRHVCLECHQNHKERDCPSLNRRPSFGPSKGRQRGEVEWFPGEGDDRYPFRNKGAAPR